MILFMITYPGRRLRYTHHQAMFTRVNLAMVVSLSVLTLAGQQASDLDAKLTAKIDAALQKSGAPSVAVAVVKDGRTAFAKSFGKADIAAGRAAAADTRYAVGSISKQFTVAALLLAQE